MAFRRPLASLTRTGAPKRVGLVAKQVRNPHIAATHLTGNASLQLCEVLVRERLPVGILEQPVGALRAPVPQFGSNAPAVQDFGGVSTDGDGITVWREAGRALEDGHGEALPSARNCRGEAGCVTQFEAEYERRIPILDSEESGGGQKGTHRSRLLSPGRGACRLPGIPRRRGRTAERPTPCWATEHPSRT